MTSLQSLSSGSHTVHVCVYSWRLRVPVVACLGLFSSRGVVRVAAESSGRPSCVHGATPSRRNTSPCSSTRTSTPARCVNQRGQAVLIFAVEFLQLYSTPQVTPNMQSERHSNLTNARNGTNTTATYELQLLLLREKDPRHGRAGRFLQQATCAAAAATPAAEGLAASAGRLPPTTRAAATSACCGTRPRPQ